jgi:hypothetical protein
MQIWSISPVVEFVPEYQGATSMGACPGVSVGSLQEPTTARASLHGHVPSLRLARFIPTTTKMPDRISEKDSRTRTYAGSEAGI